MTVLHLGLIGDNIATSRSPRLHELAGAQAGIRAVYDRLVPHELGKDFDAVFRDCAAGDFRGVNITYPYKERAAEKTVIEDPTVAAIGAVNTVIFEKDGPRGHNTDYSGFIAAYRHVRGQAAPGTVCMVGAGGAGRAIAFGLARLGAKGLNLVDRSQDKAGALAERLGRHAPEMAIRVFADVARATDGAEGLVNATPVGMVGHGGTVFSAEDITGARWVFDAVYTPVETEFLRLAATAGAEVISGYELFFYQGVDAWRLFHGAPPDREALRRALLTTP